MTIAARIVVAVFAALSFPQLADAKRDRAELRGVVSARPEGGSGEWVVDGKAFVADARTELDAREGPLVVGACVKVRYAVVEGRAVALEIDSEPAHDCAGSRVPAGTR
jgi:hypothetical protein